tara:strand:+ start:1074 stop:1568 length:495 start_codon:yes stop_codon:yes gene_type:complete
MEIIMDKNVWSKHYEGLLDCLWNQHENYKELLTLMLKTAKEKDAKLLSTIKLKRKKLKGIVEKYEADISDLAFKRKVFKEAVSDVKREYSFRRKISGLEKKHSYLAVFWDGDEDVYTTWVYSDDFRSGEDPKDPFCDSHYHHSYEEAYHACLTYIKHHETKEVT